MQCPECDIKLQIMEREGHVGFCCAKCSGVFLTKKYIYRLNFKPLESAEKFYSSLEKGLSGGSDYGCPNCKNKMNVSIYKNVELDICCGCKSVWFDFSELCSTITFCKNSKVDSTRFTKDDVLSRVIDFVLGIL
jgi:Zn-finger nucleic acid-binding protein